MKRPLVTKRGGEHGSLSVSPKSSPSQALQLLLIRRWVAVSPAFTVISAWKERTRLLSSFEKNIWICSSENSFRLSMGNDRRAFLLPVIRCNKPKKRAAFWGFSSCFSFLLLTKESFWFFLDATMKELTLLNAFYREFRILPKVLGFALRISSIKCSKF